MEILTYQEIKTLLNRLADEFDISLDNWMQEDVSEEGVRDESPEIADALGSFECVEQFGGEGSGDDYFSIFEFKDHGVFVKFDGWYALRHGCEFSNMYNVTPKQVTKTEYVVVGD